MATAVVPAGIPEAHEAFVQTYPGVGSTKLTFAVLGIGAGWYLYQTGTVAEVKKGESYSFKPPFKIKTTYLLYSGAILGYLVGGVVGNALYGPPAKSKSKK